MENEPVWACSCTAAQYQKLPPIKFTVLANAKGDTREFEMPRAAYMKLDKTKPGIGLLMLTPW